MNSLLFLNSCVLDCCYCCCYRVENVPVTKLITFIFLLFTLFGSDHSTSFSLDILRCYYEIWRVLTSFLVYENLAQSLVTLVLLFNLSTFEMQMGSRKYATFLVFVWIVSLLLEVAAGVLAELVMAVRFVPAPGPYLLVFAPLALYYSKCDLESIFDR